MKTIVVFNQKGGVGKTSTVANLMAEFTSRKLSVLAIDLDPQCNLTAFCGLRSAEDSSAVCEWLLEERSFSAVVRASKYGDVVPSDDRLQMELLHFASIPAFVVRIRDLLAKVSTRYDYVLIDCPPAVNQVTAAALVAADYVLIPSEAELFSAAGVGKIAETINQVKALNNKIRVLGVLLVKYNARRNLTKGVEERLIEGVRNLLKSEVLESRIRFTVEIPGSQASGYSARDFAPSGHAAADYASLADEILEVMKYE